MMLGRAYRRCSAALSPPTRFCTVTLGTYREGFSQLFLDLCVIHVANCLGSSHPPVASVVVLSDRGVQRRDYGHKLLREAWGERGL